MTTFGDFRSLKAIYPAAAAVLLADWTTCRNIMWMNDNYRTVASLGEGSAGLLEGHAAKGEGAAVYSRNPSDPMDAESVVELGVRPRREKSRQEQDKRCSDRDEVYTPAWQVSRQMNTVDSIWFGRDADPSVGLFTVDRQGGYDESPGKVLFPPSRTWMDYITRRCIEPCEGEGAYVQTARDSRTGEEIPLIKRTGMLDRKLRVVAENTETPMESVKWAFCALRHVWGYEYQGDSLLIARLNILSDFEEWLLHMCPSLAAEPKYPDMILAAADTVSRNHVQMDGLTWTVPGTCSPSCEGCASLEPRLHDGVYAKSYDWDAGEWFFYRDLAKSPAEQNVNALF